MILPIYTYGQSVLRNVADDIDPDYPDLKQLIQDMYDTLERSEGIGIETVRLRYVIGSDLFTRQLVGLSEI